MKDSKEDRINKVLKKTSFYPKIGSSKAKKVDPKQPLKAEDQKAAEELMKSAKLNEKKVKVNKRLLNNTLLNAMQSNKRLKKSK